MAGLSVILIVHESCQKRITLLARVRAQAELATARAQGQAWEAPGRARERGWGVHPVRQRLVQVLLA
jgi:hypothetical protein